MLVFGVSAGVGIGGVVDAWFVCGVVIGESVKLIIGVTVKAKVGDAANGKVVSLGATTGSLLNQEIVIAKITMTKIIKKIFMQNM